MRGSATSLYSLNMVTEHLTVTNKKNPLWFLNTKRKNVDNNQLTVIWTPFHYIFHLSNNH